MCFFTTGVDYRINAISVLSECPQQFLYASCSEIFLLRCFHILLFMTLCQITNLNVFPRIPLPIKEFQRLFKLLLVFSLNLSPPKLASSDKGSSLTIGDALDIMFQRTRSNDKNHICRPPKSLLQTVWFCGQLSGL